MTLHIFFEVSIDYLSGEQNTVEQGMEDYKS